MTWILEGRKIQGFSTLHTRANSFPLFYTSIPAGELPDWAWMYILSTEPLHCLLQASVKYRITFSSWAIQEILLVSSETLHFSISLVEGKSIIYSAKIIPFFGSAGTKSASATWLSQSSSISSVANSLSFSIFSSCTSLDVKLLDLAYEQQKIISIAIT